MASKIELSKIFINPFPNIFSSCFQVFVVEVFWIHCEKRRNGSFSHSINFSIIFENLTLFSSNLNLLPASSSCLDESKICHSGKPRPSGSVVSVLDWWPGGCEFDPRLRRLFFPAYFCLSPLQKHVRKVVGGFGKKSCVSTGVRKPGNTYASLTAIIWP